MRKFTLFAEGYIDEEAEFEYKHINRPREIFPLMHDHDYYEFLLVVKGELQHHVNNESFKLQKGHLVFIRPGDCHALLVHDQQECHFVNLAVMQKTIDDMFCYLGEGVNRKLFLDGVLPPTVFLTSSELQGLLNELDKLNTLPVHDKKRLNTVLRIILIDLLSEYLMTEREKDEILPDWLRRTLDALKDPEYFKSGLPAVKKIACKSDEHLSRSFKKYLDRTPTQYINELRLNFAANQIRFTTKKISEICYDAGFENQSNFHRQFLSFFNYTPNQFRKHHQRELSINT